MGKALFPLGEIAASEDAMQAIEKCGQSPKAFLDRHVRGEWGDMTASDILLVKEAIVGGEQILTAHQTKGGDRIWVVTSPDRQSTLLLLAGEEID